MKTKLNVDFINIKNCRLWFEIKKLMSQRLFPSKFIYVFGHNVDKKFNCRKHANIVFENLQTSLFKSQ